MLAQSWFISTVKFISNRELDGKLLKNCQFYQVVKFNEQSFIKVPFSSSEI